MQRQGLHRIVSLKAIQEAEVRGELVRRHYPVGMLQQIVPAFGDNFRWTPLTMLTYGGLLIDREGFVVARPATPVFDINTNGLVETYESKLPKRECTYTAIVDGTSAVIAKNQITGVPLVITQGGFYDPISSWATGWFNKTLAPAKWPEGWTPNVCVQTILDRRIVQTGRKQLTLVAMVNNLTGEEMPLSDVAKLAHTNGLSCLQTLDECGDDPDATAKGFVQTFPVKGGGPLKVRVLKGSYQQTWKHVQRATVHMLWKACRANLTYYDRVKDDSTLPAGYIEFVQRQLDILRTRYAVMRKNAEGAFERIPPSIATDAERRQWLLDVSPEFAHALNFRLEGDEKGYTEALWDRVAPPPHLAGQNYFTY